MSGPRISQIELRELGERLSGRDRSIVWQVGELRLMSGGQIAAVHFPVEMHATAATAARHCRRVLGRLVRDQLLVRLERRIGGLRAGSNSFVYGLGPIGQRLLHDGGSRLRTYEPSTAFVDHQLAVSQLVVDLVLASRLDRFEILKVETEPSCWRSVPGFARSILRPDLFLAIGVGEYEYRSFVEVDRGTHRNPALLRKARLYESYYRSGIEQAEHQVFPKVVWITPNDNRAETVATVLSGEGFTPKLMHAVTSADALAVLAGGGR